MKIKARNARAFLEHCEALETITGQPFGYEQFCRFKSLEDKLQRLAHTAEHRPLSIHEKAMRANHKDKVRFILGAKFRAQVKFGNTSQGYLIRLASPEIIFGERINTTGPLEPGYPDALHPLPVAMFKDEGYGILAPNF